MVGPGTLQQATRHLRNIDAIITNMQVGACEICRANFVLHFLILARIKMWKAYLSLYDRDGQPFLVVGSYTKP